MYELNSEKMFFDIADGQAVVINFTTGMYYGTSTLGSAVLASLLEGASTDAILRVLKENERCPEDIEDRIHAFVRTLEEKEILIRRDTPGSSAVEIEESAFSDGFELTLDEYAEVQDLLLADPVHDVDAEQGWPIMKED